VRSRNDPSQRPWFRDYAATSLLAVVAILGQAIVSSASPPRTEEEAAEPSNRRPPIDSIEVDQREFSATGVRKFRKRLPRPIKLGVSGGNVNDIIVDGDLAYCISGTLGALVLKNGTPHILSNNHVIGRQNAASKGDAISQPGLIDNRCRDEEEDYVGHLSAYKKIRFGGLKRNRIDAAIAEIVPGTVDPQGTIQGIGVPGDTVMKPFLGMHVKKSGRSSGLTRGIVILLNATVVVDFSTEDEQKTAKFVNQLMVTPNGNTFVEPGDSGSAVFFDSPDCPEWVGLLFAGSSDGWGIVNPISQVFKSLKKLKPKGRVTPIGCSSEDRVIGLDPLSIRAASSHATDTAKLERQLRQGRRIVERRDDDLLTLDGVVGLGLGISDQAPARIVLHVLVADERPEVIDRIPATLEDMPVEITRTGRFRAFKREMTR
jgi:hypothetical protein